MLVGVIGVNHKLANLKLRESFAKLCQQRFHPENSIHGNHVLVPLSTCNRTEVYFSSQTLSDTHSYIINILRKDLRDIEESFDQKLYSYFGDECFHHLARVTAGLDSAIVAETEIQGQVKAAYECAKEKLRLPGAMHYLFQKSLKIGKERRTKLPIGRGIPDVEHAILTAGYQAFDQPEKAKLLFVGASEINRRILLFLQSKKFTNLTLCNRTDDTSYEFAKKYQLSILEWEDLMLWPNYDWIIFGTKSPKHLISKKNFTKEGHKLIIDLCVPRNVDPSLGKLPTITLYNIDQINRTLKTRRQRVLHMLSTAEEFVYAQSKKQIVLFHNREHRQNQRLEVLEPLNL